MDERRAKGFKKTKWAEVFYECSAWVEGRHTSAARKCGGVVASSKCRASSTAMFFKSKT